MLTQLEIFGRPSDPLGLPINNTYTAQSPIQIKEITGLGPVKAEITTSPYSDVDGEADVGESVGKRNIVITVGFNPDWVDQTIESLRALLYTYVMPKSKIRLRFTSTHLPVCEIAGKVESAEPNLFSNEPEMQISVICSRPDFVAIAPTTENGVVTADASVPAILDYIGTSPTGFVLEVESAAARPSFTGMLNILAENDDDSDLFRVDVTTAIDATHLLRLSSVELDRYVKNFQNPGATVVNLLGKMVIGSKWPMLRNGPNEFSVYAGSPGQVWDMTYYARFGGL